VNGCSRRNDMVSLSLSLLCLFVMFVMVNFGSSIEL